MKVDFNSKLKGVASDIADSANSLTSGTTRLANRAVDKHICIGVTGFSGSGKSTFITSLIHQLRYSNAAQLGGFLPARDQQIVDVKLAALPNLPLFDYQNSIEQLASMPPKWPHPTSELSGCTVEITYKRSSIFKSVLGKTTKLKIEIRDYPGEWLLDIPLLEQDYLSWCLESTEFLDQTVRKSLLGPLHSQLQSIKPFDVLTESELGDISAQYVQFLKDSKEKGLTLIQPGHMLLPGRSDTFSHFFPLLGLKHYDKSALNKADDNCVYKVMQKRFNAYVTDTVTPFYHDFFKSVDRQVILIDTLKALGGNKENFEDMMIAFSRIIDSYKVGLNGFVGRLISPKVERILFLSSKPDGILINQHENLRHLTDSIIQRVCKQSTRNTIRIETEIACAVRSTEDNSSYLTANLLADGKRGNIVHPTIPDHIPTEQDWKKFEAWQPLELQPPIIPDLKHGARLPSIRMDKVIRDLIGDKFQ